ncbi:hypothetical protein SAMN04488074_106324 [Lentzea albidocapillata subsp. violacea]|uniref:4-amino-4-deoxy-L-arabinose transferase n=1 Tax=Lentzea albidocapillata subsp. violacea TaxID=128104 RepID=A0A1G9DN54_9PSEU|nr:DUF6541 family protein [Lentzea albidocapillata]SDK65230.1 hypothetical protein SAMN04488074_106324 [Lentzea albidocapillata subsp. violacea]
MGALVILAFWLPGLVVGFALRLRGWLLAGAAPVLTFGTVAVGALVLGKLGVEWTMLSVVLWTLVLAFVTGAITWLVHRRVADSPDETPKRTLGEHLLIVGGVVLGMAVGAVTYWRGIGQRLDTINQDWDAPFHGNAIRWISEHHNSLPSSLAPTANLPGKLDYFYPNTYHAFLAPMLDNFAAMPQLLNLAVFGVLLAWPIGIAAFALSWRLPPLAVAAAAAVSTWFTAFPYDSLWRGPLWPFVAAVALLPAALALVRKLFTDRGLTGPIAVSIALAGMVGLHTSLAFIILVYAVTLLLAMVFKFEPIDWKAQALPLLTVVVIAIVAVVPVALPALAPVAGVTGAQWPEFASPVEGFGQILLFSPVNEYPQWFLGFAAFAGIVLMVRNRILPWLVASYAILGMAYAATASLNNDFVNMISGPFYNDAWRIATLLSLAGSVAIGYLVWTLGEKLPARVREKVGPKRAAYVTPLTIALVFLAVLGVVGKAAYIGRNSYRLALNNREDETVRRGEREAYQWLAQNAKGTVVMNDRLDGSVWMYALAGVRPAEWQFYGAPDNSAAHELTLHLNELATNAKVRKAVDTLGIRYVLYGKGLVRKDWPRSPGIDDLGNYPEIARKVYENPDATVYELIKPGDGNQRWP